VSKRSYIWNESKISSIDILEGPNASRAVLHASPDLPEGALQDLPALLKKAKLSYQADVVDGENVLVIDGLGPDKEKKLLQLLEGAGAVSPNALVQDGAANHKPKNFAQNIGDGAHYLFKENPLVLHGLFGVLGNILQGVAGYFEGDKDRMLNGFFVNNIIAGIPMLFGSGGRPLDAEQTNRRLREHWAKDGIEVPDLRTLAGDNMEKHRGFIESTWNWVQDNMIEFVASHPIEISQGFALWSNVNTLRGGLTEYRAGAKEGKHDQGLGRLFQGTLGFAGAMFAVFGQDKHEEVGHAEQGAEGKDDKKKMKVSSTFLAGILDTAMNAGQVYDAFKMRQRHVEHANTRPGQINAVRAQMDGFDWSQDDANKKFAGLTKQHEQYVHDLSVANRSKKIGNGLVVPGLLGLSSVCYMASGLMLAKGEKGKIAADDTVVNHVNSAITAEAAQMIMQFPEEQRVKALTSTAYALSHKFNIGKKPEEVAAEINEKMKAMERSPWKAKVERETATRAASEALGLSGSGMVMA
jgi:hypothetical protein